MKQNEKMEMIRAINAKLSDDYIATFNIYGGDLEFVIEKTNHSNTHFFDLKEIKAIKEFLEMGAL